MPTRIPPFKTHHYYHLFNRGVAKQEIFRSPNDYRFFIERMNLNTTIKGAEIVTIHCYCLMPNHFHMLIEQHKDEGISAYLHRFLCTYSMHFNTLYTRVGPLFQSRTKATWIGSDASFKAVSHYIHRNPLKILTLPEDLAKYPYSSYPYYIKESRARQSKLLSLFDNNPQEYERFVSGKTEMESPGLAPVSKSSPAPASPIIIFPHIHRT